MKNTFLLSFLCFLLVPGSYCCHLSLDKMYGGTFADCTKSNLSSIPTGLPANTTSLDLSYNNITVLRIPNDIKWKSLKYLDVSYNRQKVIYSGTFELFDELQELYLQNNMLTLDNVSYPDDVFRPLQKLRKLHLHNNDGRSEGSYPDVAFSNLQNVVELKLDTFRETYFGPGFAKLFNLNRLLLGFTGCKLVHIRNRTLENLISIPIFLIDFDRCPIRKIEVGCFLPLRSLKYLYLSNTEDLAPTAAVFAMFGLRGMNVSVLEMNNIVRIRNFRNPRLNERILSNPILLHLKDVCIERFAMTNNQLLWIGNRVIGKTTFSRCIKHLDLSMNDFYGDMFYSFTLIWLPNIVFLNVSRHSKYVSGLNIFKSGLRRPTVGLTFPDTLEVLSCDGIAVNNIEIFTNVHVYNAKSLQYVSFANNRLSRFFYRFTGLENLTSLDISGNNCSDMNQTFFEDFPNLESLNMTNVQFRDTFLLLYGRRLLRPLRRLGKLNLNSNNIRLLDRLIFSSNPIKEVKLSNNRFELIPFDLSTSPELQHLDLSYNSLAVLSSAEMELLDKLAMKNNLTLNLEGNILSCGCHNLEFMLWLYKTNVQVIRKSAYICQMSEGGIANASYIIDNYDEIWMSCNSAMTLSVTIILFTVLLLLSVFIYLTDRKRTLLINILLRMFGYETLRPPIKRADFLNDAYIGYSDADYQYICHTLRDHLETRHGLKLFIRDRDTIPGGQIADDIISGIDCSWRTVLFLTAAFLDDQWCLFTVNRVVYSCTRVQQRKVIIVLFDDVMRRDIPPSLLNVVEETNIFYVDRYTTDEYRLWKDVCRQINS